jgi:short-subunit dehydrogenase
MRSIAGKVAVVTGASRGIGIEIAKVLGGAGARLSLAARSVPELEKVRSDLDAAGVQAVAVPTDVGDPDALRKLVETTETSLGPIDILINNAGIETIAPFDALSLDEIASTIQVNVTGLTWLTRLVVPSMIRRRTGHIVSIASNAGMVGVAYNAVYSTSKHAVVGLSRSLRAELAPHGIGVSVICPGFVDGERVFENFEGRKPPALAGMVTKDSVAKAVQGAIVRNRGEVIVNKGLGRVIDWFQAVAPDFTQNNIRRTGVTDLFREQAMKNAKR